MTKYKSVRIKTEDHQLLVEHKQKTGIALASSLSKAIAMYLDVAAGRSAVVDFNFGENPPELIKK